MQDYWWVTRPKRKLNPIPEELAAFCSTALGKKWTRNRDSHIEFEIELEQTGTKRVGERRDASGSGGRTHAAMREMVLRLYCHNHMLHGELIDLQIVENR